MDIRYFTENFKKELKDMNIFRLRLFNIKLFGDIRKGFYKEISVDEITGFISDFRDFCNRKNEVHESGDDKPELTENSNFKILERLCEQYYVYEDTDKFQKKIILEIRLFCYIQAGFTPTMMSVLLRKDKSVVYNRVSRLKAKIR